MTPASFELRAVDCPVCGSENSRFVGWRSSRLQEGPAEITIVRCRECTHLYPDPMPFPADGLSDIYNDGDEYFHNHELSGKKEIGLKLMKEFESRLGRKGRVLDLGCGLGEFMWAARESGWQVSGIDPSKEFVQEANRRFDLEAKVSTLEEAAFPDEHFDAVIMSGIIEHLYDPYSTLVEVNRIIRPGGWLFLDAPNENGLYMRMGNLYMRLLGKRHVVVLAPTFPPYHVQGFNTQSIRRALTRAGFTVASLEIAGGVCEQVGPSNIRKKAEYGAGKMINGIGRLIGMGSYMAVWSKKGPSTAERPD